MADRWKGDVLKRALIWVVCLALLLGIVVKLLPNDERLIRKRLAAIAANASVQSNESPLARVAHASKLVDYFTPDVSLQVEGLDTPVNDRNDLREAILAARSSWREAEVQFADVHVRFPEQKDLAVAYLTAIAYLNGQTNPVGRELKVTLQKANGEWLVSRVESMVAGP